MVLCFVSLLNLICIFSFTKQGNQGQAYLCLTTFQPLGSLGQCTRRSTPRHFEACRCCRGQSKAKQRKKKTNASQDELLDAWVGGTPVRVPHSFKNQSSPFYSRSIMIKVENDRSNIQKQGLQVDTKSHSDHG